MARVSMSTAIAEVASRDPALAKIIAQIGPIRQLPRSEGGKLSRIQDLRHIK